MAVKMSEIAQAIYDGMPMGIEFWEMKSSAEKIAKLFQAQGIEITDDVPRLPNNEDVWDV